MKDVAIWRLPLSENQLTLLDQQNLRKALQPVFELGGGKNRPVPLSAKVPDKNSIDNKTFPYPESTYNLSDKLQHLFPREPLLRLSRIQLHPAPKAKRAVLSTKPVRLCPSDPTHELTAPVVYRAALLAAEHKGRNRLGRACTNCGSGCESWGYLRHWACDLCLLNHANTLCIKCAPPPSSAPISADTLPVSLTTDERPIQRVYEALPRHKDKYLKLGPKVDTCLYLNVRSPLDVAAEIHKKRTNGGKVEQSYVFMMDFALTEYPSRVDTEGLQLKDIVNMHHPYPDPAHPLTAAMTRKHHVLSVDHTGQLFYKQAPTGKSLLLNAWHRLAVSYNADTKYGFT